MTTFSVVTLGCARNEVDSEQLSARLVAAGYRPAADPGDADVVLVNTCTFITPATQESVDTVLAACDLKTSGARAVLAVGCMAERYRDELAAAVPELDAVLGMAAYPAIADVVNDVLAGRGVPRFIPDARGFPRGDAGGRGPARGGRRGLPLVAEAGDGPAPASGPRFPPRHRDRSRPWAYLKLAEGCDRRCTFCAIPSWRGAFRSRPLEEVVAEAEWLAGVGTRELVLVSENTTSWGKDLTGGRGAQPRLLERLSDIEGVERVRLVYLQPDELTSDLVGAVAGLPKVASYFDLSLQHVAAPVLRAMSRSGSPERFTDLVDSIRAVDPGAVFRSNFIVGFPGERDEDVAALVGFLEDARLDWVGVFAFSPQDGTPAATLPGQVPAEEAEARLRVVTEVAERVAGDAARDFVGRRLDVTVEEHADGGSIGRSYREAPEVDGEIRLVAPGGDGWEPAWVAVGRTVPAEVVAADGIDLVAVPEPGVADGVVRGG